MKYSEFLNQLRSVQVLKPLAGVDLGWVDEVMVGSVLKVEENDVCGEVFRSEVSGKFVGVFSELLGSEYLVVEESGEYELDISGKKHICIRVTEGIDCKFVDKNLDQSTDRVGLVEIIVEEGAKVEFLSLNNGGKEVLSLNARVAEGASMTWKLGKFHQENSLIDVRSVLIGESANSDVYWVMDNLGSQKNDYFAGNSFDAKNCTGEIIAKSVAAEKCRVNFIGEIDITLQGGGTDSYLKQDVLMLDDTCFVEAVPSLEIKTNDVKAGHGVSISKLNDDRLFYLMSRGVDKETARALVLNGFLKSVYAEFGNEGLVEKIDAILAKDLNLKT